MKPGEHYDAAVVGAGPAGSTAAKRLGQAGLKVILLEQKKVIGAHVQCAEFVPRVISRYAALRQRDIAQEVQGIKTFINGRLENSLQAPGYILNRACWDEYQADTAGTAGASVVSGTRVAGIKDNVMKVVSGNQAREVTADYILGCDGPHSLVSNKLGNKRQELCTALQYELVLNNPLNYAGIYFEPAYYGGYAWVFPKGKTANIGLAVHDSCKDRLKLLLEDFCRQLLAARVVRDPAAVTATGGLIPAGGLVRCLANNHMLVAGDAAGCTHPITGAGIMNAVVSGHLAAMAVILAVNSKGAEPVSETYPRTVTAEYGQQFALAGGRLLRRNQGWTEDKEKFLALIRQNWIAFPEYYA